MSNDRDNRSNATNLIIAMLSCMLAPIISHILDLCVGNNQWNTERLLILYFASVTGFVIQDKVYRIIKERKSWFMLGDSDAVGFIIWLFPVSIVVIMYNDLPSMICLAVLVIASLIIVARDYDRINITWKTMALIAVALTVLAFASSMFAPMIEKQPFAFFGNWMLCQIACCTVFDFIRHLCFRRKRKNE